MDSPALGSPVLGAESDLEMAGLRSPVEAAVVSVPSELLRDTSAAPATEDVSTAGPFELAGSGAAADEVPVGWSVVADEQPKLTTSRAAKATKAALNKFVS